MQSVWHSGILKSWKPKTSRDSKGYDDYFFRTLFSLHVVLNDVCWEISINTESHNFHNLRIYFSITLKIMKLWVKSDGNTTYSIKTMMSLWVFLSLFLLTRLTFRKRVTQKWQLLQNYFCDALHSFTKQKFAWMMSRNLYCINFLDHRVGAKIMGEKSTSCLEEKILNSWLGIF